MVYHGVEFPERYFNDVTTSNGIFRKTSGAFEHERLCIRELQPPTQYASSGKKFGWSIGNFLKSKCRVVAVSPPKFGTPFEDGRWTSRFFDPLVGNSFCSPERGPYKRRDDVQWLPHHFNFVEKDVDEVFPRTAFWYFSAL